MATVEEVARTVEGAGDNEEAVAKLTAAGLSVAAAGTPLLVGGNVAVARTGGTTLANTYWIVYDVHNPSKSKMKVAGRKPGESDQTPTESGSGT